MSRYVPKYARQQNYGNQGRNETTSSWSNSNSYDNFQAPQFSNPDEEVQYYQQQTKQVKQDTRDTSRNALRKLRETEQLAQSNMVIIGQQSEQFNRIEAKMDNIEDHVKSSEKKTNELKKLNRAFFLPSFAKSKKKLDKSEKKLNEKIKKREEELNQRNAQYSQRIQENIENVNNYNGQPMYNDNNSKKSKKNKNKQPEPPVNNRIYAYGEKDEYEDEISSNLDEMSSGLARLKMMSLEMSKEFDRQNESVQRIQDRSDVLKNRIDYNSRRLDNFNPKDTKPKIPKVNPLNPF